MLVSFIVVAYNAGDKITSLFRDLERQDYNPELIEVILVDSNSQDNTKEIMVDFIKSNYKFSRAIVLDNPKKTLPCGWNLALKESRGEIILRVDAHSSIPTNFISTNVECIARGEYICGGKRNSIVDANNIWEKTLLLTEKSLFGSGIALYRRNESERYVTTLAHAAYKKEVFERVGGYDERLARTEDNEIHYRMREAGFKFYFSPKIKSDHHVRSTFSKMIKQKFLNGYWIGLTLGISPRCFSIYHFMPLVFVLAIFITTAFSMVTDNYFTFTTFWGLYGFCAILIAILSIIKERFSFYLLLMPILFLILHLSYGLGSLIGILKLYSWLSREENKRFQIPSINNAK